MYRINIGHSTVTLDTITTSGNIWYGVGIDKSSVVKVIGTSAHTDTAHLVNDNTSNTTLDDVSNQYVAIAQIGNKRVYQLGGLTAPINLTPLDDLVTSDKNFSMTWDVVTHAASYEYQTSNARIGDELGSTIYSDSSITKPERYSVNGGVVTRANQNTPDGIYYWRVRALDAAGKAGPWSEVQSVRVDTTAPATPVITNPSGWHLSVAQVQWSVSTDTSDVTYSLYEGSHRSNVNTLITQGVEATSYGHEFTVGPHFIRVVATDAAGNKTSSAVRGFTVIGTPKILTPVEREVLNEADGSTFTTTWSSVAGVEGTKEYVVEYSIDRNGDGDFNDANEVVTRKVTSPSTSYTQTFTTDFQGIMSVRVRAVYNIAYAGSVYGPWSEAVAYRWDSKNPDKAIVTSINEYAIKGTAEPNSIVSIKINESSVVTTQADGMGAWSYTFNPILSSGDYSFAITVEDTAGNKSDVVEVAHTVVTNEATGDEATGTGENSSVSGRTLLPIAAPSAAAPVAPAALFFGDTAATTEDEGEVLGAQTSRDNDKESSVAANVAAVPTAQGWKLFGLLWYWWLLILAVVAAVWWIIAAARRRKQDEEA